MYENVYRLKQALPHLSIVINGGINTLEESEQHLNYVDGVMIGREAYNNPYLLAGVDQHLFGVSTPSLTRKDVALKYIQYCDNELKKGVRLHHISRHMLGLFQGERGARAFRRHISENAYKTHANTDILKAALDKVY